MRASNFGLLTWQLGEIFPTGGWGSLGMRMHVLGPQVKYSAVDGSQCITFLSTAMAM